MQLTAKETLFKKGIHHNIDIENSILGVCLFFPKAFCTVSSIIQDERIFYSEANSIVFKCLNEMYEANMGIDLITAAHFIMNVKNINELNGSSVGYYLSVLTDRPLNTPNLSFWCMALYDLFVKREVLRVKYQPLDSTDPFDGIDEMNKKFTELTSVRIKKSWYSMDEMIIKLFEHQDKMRLTEGVGVTTGFPSIDKRGGFFGGDLIFLGARPSVGKSAFANSIALNMGKRNSAVGIVSLEMSNIQVAARIVASDADVDFSVVYRGLMVDEAQMQRVYEKISNQTSGYPIFVSDKTDVNVHDIKRQAEILIRDYKAEMIIIDYLQLVNTENSKYSNRENEISKISRTLKITAKEFDIPIIILGQLNREVTKRKGNDRFPVLSDIRESGSIEQDCDAVFFLHSDFMSGVEFDADGNSTKGKVVLVNRKWRNNDNNFHVPMSFNGSRMTFTELDEDYTVAESKINQSSNPMEDEDNPF